jgi:hypothetical protein
MKTRQPVWKFAGNLGDATPLDHGGAFVLVDETGVYDPEIHLSNADTRERSFLVLEPVHECPNVPGQYGDNKFHPDFPAWWSDKLASVAECFGMEKGDLAEILLSKDPMERAAGYQTLVGYFGPYEFDQYPIKLTRKEARKWIASIDASLV